MIIMKCTEQIDIEVIKYSKNHEILLFEMLLEEGEDWADYHSITGRDKYIKALESSITYIIFDNKIICGYVRCREDDGFGIYVYDLLVRKQFRGKQFGRILMERVKRDHPEQPVYVMSDVDLYYTKLGYNKVGSIFQVEL